MARALKTKHLVSTGRGDSQGGSYADIEKRLAVNGFALSRYRCIEWSGLKTWIESARQDTMTRTNRVMNGVEHQQLISNAAD
jgi:hypothetical protein